MIRPLALVAATLGVFGCTQTGPASIAPGLVASCAFDRYVRGNERGATDWTALIAPDQVTVPGSGAWPAQVGRTPTGGLVVQFETQAAVETIEINPQGNALWDIEFKRGGLLVYIGDCQVAA